MKNYIKCLLVLALVLILPFKVFASEVTNVFIDKYNNLSFTGVEGYNTYHAYIKLGETTINEFDQNADAAEGTNVGAKIWDGCDNYQICNDDYTGNYTLEIVALDSENHNVPVEDTRTTNTVRFKHEYFNGYDYNHVDVVGNEAEYTIVLDPNDDVQEASTLSTHYKFGDHVQLGTFESYGYTKQPHKYYYGWEFEDFNVTHDMTVQYSWEPLFTMSFDFNGGTFNGQGTYSKEVVAYVPSLSLENIMSAFEEGGEVIAPAHKELDYITINGVRRDVNPDEGFIAGQDNEIVYYWKWDSSVTVHTVTLTDGLGNTLDTVEVLDGETLTRPSDPVVGRLIFCGWYLGDTGYNFETPVTGDITLEASWNFNFNVVANVNGAAIFTYNGIDYPNSVGSAGYYHENEILGIDQRDVNGYELIEWRVGDAEGPIVGSDSSADYYVAPGGHLKIKQKAATSNLNFVAIYQKTKVAVNFVTNGGTAIDIEWVKPGERATRPGANATTKAGYILDTWYTDPELTHEYNFSTPLDDEITLYAGWNVYLTEVRGYVGKPVDGFTIDNNIVSADENKYTFEFRYWYAIEEGYPHIEGNATFEKDKEYEIRLRVIPAEGYGVDGDTVFYLNDEETSCFGSAEDRQIRWVATDPVEVNDFNVTGFYRPYVGYTADLSKFKFATEGLSIIDAFWTEESSGEELTSTSKFETGKRYILHVRFNTKYGYVLASEYNEDVISITQDYLKAEYINNFDEYEMQIFYEATAAPKLTAAPTVKVANGNNNSVVVTWNAVNYATRYDIYRSDNKKKWTKVGTTTGTTFTNGGLTYGKTYYYKVTAVNTTSSKTSAIVSGKTIPNKVTNVRISSVGEKNIKISWDKVGVTGYEVYMGSKKIATITKNGTLNCNKTKLKANTVYSFKVRAYKTVSGRKVYGPFSTVVTTKTTTVKPKVTLSIKNYDSMTLSVGSVSGATKYIVQSSLDGKTYTLLEEFTKAPTLTFINHEVGTNYYYRVTACNSYNRCTGWVVVSKKQTTRTPGFTLVTTSKKVTVTLSKCDEADGYEIYRSTRSNKGYTRVKEIISGVDVPLVYNNATKKGTTYYYKVRSYKIVNGTKVYSAFSNYKKIRSK